MDYKLEVEFSADDDEDAKAQVDDALLNFSSIKADRLTNDVGQEVE